MILTVDLLDEESVKKAAILLNEMIKPDPHVGISIFELELTCRSHNCLKAQNISTIDELCSLSKNELRKTPNLGPKSLAEIILNLSRLGLDLRN